MGDQKDHATIQKKETEVTSNAVETQNYETASESITPPTFQLKSEPTQEKVEKEAQGQESESEGAFQFALASPPDKPGSEDSKTISGDSVQKKGVAEPFKMPIVQKKEFSASEKSTDKPSFKL